MATRKTATTTEEVVEKETATTEATVYDPDELVPFMAPISRDRQSDIYVCVNGENCVIQRGKQVQIKRKFYEVLMNSTNMDNLAFMRQQELQS